MGWKFWKRKDEDAKQINHLQEEIANMNLEMKNVTDKVTKLTRTQFKSSKNIEEKMDNFASTLISLNEQNDVVTQMQRYERQRNFTIQHLIQLLDEMDHVVSGINGREQVWLDLLAQWSRTILRSLEEMGIIQLEVNGKTFNPEVSESLKTVSMDSLNIVPAVPYQVVEVLNRGYITNDGRLVRKAKVVTVEEEKYGER